MKLMDKFRKIPSMPGNITLGKKEKDLGNFKIECIDCKTLIDIDETNCPRRIKKMIKRNMKMRGIAMIALERMNPRCSKCHKAFLEKNKPTKVSGEDMIKIAKESADEHKAKA